MSLLVRIAINNGNAARKAEATRFMAIKERQIVESWHERLRLEIEEKMTKQPCRGRLLLRVLERQEVESLPVLQNCLTD